MNYKNELVGIMCALGALAPQGSKAYTYVVEQPVYTTPIYQAASSVYTTTPVVYPTAVPATYGTPVVYPTPAFYGNAYYDGYYDAMNRRWWYNNNWCYRRPPICRPHPIYRPHFNHCAPVRPHFNHCAPARPHFNSCRPHGGFRGHGPGGFHHGSGPRGGRCR